MSRYVSFVVLIAVILFLGILLYRVMAAFILPLFLATVLVVVFAPIHKWVLEKTSDRKVLASAITTAIISLAVILPVGGIGLVAFGEARHLFKTLTSGGIEQNVKRIRKSLNLEMPAPAEFRLLENKVRALDVLNVDELKSTESQLDRIDEAADRLGLGMRIPKVSSDPVGTSEQPLIGKADVENWIKFRDAIRNAREIHLKLSQLKAAESRLQSEADLKPPEKGGEVADDSAKSQDANEGALSIEQAIEQRKTAEGDLKTALGAIVLDYDRFRLIVLGGSVVAYFKEMANPSPEEFDQYNGAIIEWISDNFLSLGGRATQFLTGIIFNAVIMMIGVYFFLLDGPKMIAAFKFFSPLDDRHEQELIHEFEVVSRAVMVATLTAAAVQGALAGIGYYFAGVEAVFLLTLLTGFLAMVPFVGAAAVWVPTCLYLYLVDDRLLPAILLAIWGAGVVSTIDNFIKPLILHGQSNIHPLLALLSVLGGVSALGPIGILVGPMVVAFLQTLLTILQREISELDSPENGDEAEAAPSVEPPPENEEDAEVENGDNESAQQDDPK